MLRCASSTKNQLIIGLIFLLLMILRTRASLNRSIVLQQAARKVSSLIAKARIPHFRNEPAYKNMGLQQQRQRRT
ncbi:hypothetical protein C8Q75DRAFT_757744 [Abortiporus biennis]|nr:hypothetical protein C8Q75DRAFT_757744 [Abortiporus biennis]